MSNDSPRDTSVTMTAQEARAYAELGKQLDNARQQSAHVRGSGSDAIDMELFAGPGGRAYVDAMMTRVDRDQLPPEPAPAVEEAMPAVNPATLDPQSPSGSPRAMAQLRATDTIAYQGTRISVDQAVRFGLLVPASGGGYRLPSASDIAATERHQQQIESEHRSQETAELPALRERGDEPSEEAQGAINEAVSRVPGPALNALIEDVVSNGTMSEAYVTSVAHRAGMTTDQAFALAERVYGGVLQQAERAVKSVGVPSTETDALWAWAAENMPADHQNAVRSLAMASDARPLRAIARKYLSAKR